MPKIRKTSEQEAALQTIIADLKVVDRLNTVIENVEILEAGTVTVQADTAKVVLTLSSSAVNKLLGEYRKEKVSEIKTLARKYTITLDEADEKIISAGAAKKARAASTEKVAELKEPARDDTEAYEVDISEEEEPRADDVTNPVYEDEADIATSLEF